eukprot:Gb_10443 [translate_table: standard]
MEEDKAAAYYDELASKGKGAARFKQGLGYSSQPSQQAANRSNIQSSLGNFVKAATPERAAAIGKEIRVENIREKLKRKDGNGLDPQEHGDVNHRLMRQEGRANASVEKNRHRSHSSERLKGKSHGRDGRSSRRRDSCSRSPYDKHNRRYRSRSIGRGSKHHDKIRHQRNYTHSNRNRSTSSDRSREVSNRRCHRRVSRQLSSSSSSQSSDSGLRRKRRRRQSQSLSGFEDEGQSPSYSRRRGRSRSPTYRRDHSRKRKQKVSSSSSPRRERIRKEESPPCRNKQMDESKLVSRENGKEGAMKRNTAIKEKRPDIDYSKLIGGYDSMTPAERVKAKMRLQLSETVVKDCSKGMTEEWERFDFNKDAPLDDDAKLDYFGDDTGAKDDTGFLRNTGTTFLSSASQANRETQIQAAHEAAIFGTPVQLLRNTPDSNPKINNVLQDELVEENMIEGMIKNNAVEDKSSRGNVLGNSVISEQVSHY